MKMYGTFFSRVASALLNLSLQGKEGKEREERGGERKMRREGEHVRARGMVFDLVCVERDGLESPV